MKYYKISEEKLLDLIESSLELEYLETEGVDNWEWYGEGRDRFIAECLGITDFQVWDQDLTISDIAKKEIKNYEEV